jgi:hypothetical protein
MPPVNDVGEPCAREAHARFDGGRLETERNQCHRASRLPYSSSLGRGGFGSSPSLTIRTVPGWSSEHESSP